MNLPPGQYAGLWAVTEEHRTSSSFNGYDTPSPRDFFGSSALAVLYVSNFRHMYDLHGTS